MCLWPILLRDRASYRKNFRQLVNLTISSEKFLSQEQFGENTPEWPNVCGWSIEFAWEELFGRSIPAGSYTLRMLSIGWISVYFGRVKIYQFDDTSSCHNHIARLEISVHNPVLMQVSDTWEYLFHNAFDVLRLQNYFILLLEHQVLHVDWTKFKCKKQQVFQMEYVMKFNDVRVI